MEDRQFDTLVTWLAQTRLSRLAALRGLAASALAGVAVPAADGGAKRHRHRTRKHRSKHQGKGHHKQKGQGPGAAAKKPKGFQRVGKRCDKGQPCGEYTECQNGICDPTKCWIADELVDDRVVNPENPCQRCNANALNDIWSRWSDVRDGTTCPPGDSGDPCLSTFIATCQDGVCVAEPVGDGIACGDDRVCCGGTCCTAGECCGEDGACLPCGPQCVIDGDALPGRSARDSHWVSRVRSAPERDGVVAPR